MKLVADRVALIKEVIKDRSIGAEIGVRRGEFSLEFMKLQIFKIFLVDAWSPGVGEPEEDGHQEANYQACLRNLGGHMRGGRMEIVRGKSLEVAGLWKGPELDFVYIDAFHEFHAVFEDLQAWSSLLSPTGIILGHDYTETAPVAVDLNFGVVKAVNEFLRQNPTWKMTHITTEDYPSYCLQRS